MRNQTDLTAEYLKMATDALESAEILLAAGKWRAASSRTYYAAYHAISGILLTKNLKFSSHAQTLGAFNREFIKPGLFPKGYGTRLRLLFKHRQEADYIAFSPLSESIAREDVQFAEEILNACKRYLKIE
jgi:hypothetical protein